MCHTMYHDVRGGWCGDCKQWCNAAALQNKGSSLSATDLKSLSTFHPLTSVLLLQVHHQQSQVVVVGWQQRFDPALLIGLVLGSKLVRSQSWIAPHHREGELLLGLAELDGAALQNNHSYDVPVSRPVLVEEEVALQHAPALLIGSLYLTLCDNCVICGLVTRLQIALSLHFLHIWFGEMSSLLEGKTVTECGTATISQ